MGKYIRGIKRRIIVFCSNILNAFNILVEGVRIDRNVHINGAVRFINDGEILVGEQTTINSGKFINPIGGATECIIRTFPNAEISIGKNCGLSNCAIISMTKITIGDNVKIGGDVKIYDTDFHTMDYAKRRNPKTDISKIDAVVIEDDVFIGTGSIILKGVSIGKRSIIGACSVVTQNIPQNQLWAGNPCRFIRNLEEN